MQGITGSYAINGTPFSLSPTQGQWGSKDSIGIDGSGHPIYQPFTDFTVTWGYLTPSEFKQINDQFEIVASTGTAVVDLPKWGDADYSFFSYSGTILNRPTVGEYFEGYFSNVTLLITRIRA